VNLSDFPDNYTIETLYIRETENNTLDGIGHFKALKNLHFYSGYVAIKDISALTYSPKLESIVFRFTYEITDYSCLGDLSMLKSLIFFTDEVNGIEAVADCTELELLYLQDVDIESIDFISELINLKALRLYCTVENLDPLKNLKNLEILELEHNISQNEILLLSNMSSLKSIELFGVDEKIIEILRYKMPNCEINS
jgi:Leucine-rich repeat (LRR) protein